MADEQAGFRRDRSTVQQVLALRLIAEEARRKNKKIYNCFVDFNKAFDSIDQSITWTVLESYGVDSNLIEILKDINTNAQAAVRVSGMTGEYFSTNRGTRQGDPVSPNIFITVLERVKDSIAEDGAGVAINGTWINNLCFADDIDLTEEDPQRLEHTVNKVSSEAMRYGLTMNLGKTKTMVFGENKTDKTL